MEIYLGNEKIVVKLWQLTMLAKDIQIAFKEAKTLDLFKLGFDIDERMATDVTIEKILMPLISTKMTESIVSDAPLICKTHGGFIGDQVFDFSFKIWPPTNHLEVYGFKLEAK